MRVHDQVAFVKEFSDSAREAAARARVRGHQRDRAGVDRMMARTQEQEERHKAFLRQQR